MAAARCISSLLLLGLLAALLPPARAFHLSRARHARESALRRVLQVAVGGVNGTEQPIASGALYPKRLASCAWVSDYPARCELSYATVFAKGRSINASNYPARANAFIKASDIHCGTMDKAECTWPCQWDNLSTCKLADPLRLTVYDCQGSPARLYFTCSSAPRLTKAWCLATPGCSYVPQPQLDPNNRGLRACEASFYVNMTTWQRIDFSGPMYVSRMPREQVGCCKGTTYRYTLTNMCKNGGADPASCSAIQGCRLTADGSCKPTPAQKVRLQFAHWPKDPFNAQLQALAQRCDAITSADACNAYKPVAVDSGKVLQYLGQDLDKINNRVVEPAKCILPSGLAPPAGR